jgi:very-short-patch-repair endonuclease
LLRDGGLDGWARGIRFGPYEIDLGFPEVKVAIEVDGWAWRVDADRFRTDRRKQNTLVAAGWTVLRFTWHDLQKRPTQVVAEIRAALTRAA